MSNSIFGSNVFKNWYDTVNYFKVFGFQKAYSNDFWSSDSKSLEEEALYFDRIRGIFYYIESAFTETNTIKEFRIFGELYNGRQQIDYSLTRDGREGLREIIQSIRETSTRDFDKKWIVARKLNLLNHTEEKVHNKEEINKDKIEAINEEAQWIIGYTKEKSK